ncbi:hypothetical protein HPB50_022645 [Hyalomma asiaticum]|uniref:Uncharacterized protein n=1 Tax=Hyalomma asiaticum TaxID=266040 RepID=A0ACB7RYK4_HYAAI|nr:hypothetical protein HPB50_022645 [Hyalomma asiaticum]
MNIGLVEYIQVGTGLEPMTFGTTPSGHPTLLAIDRLLFVDARCQHTTLLLLAAIVCVIVATVVMFRALSRKKRKAEITVDHSHDVADMRGKTVVITGANAGIGFETALELSRLGARVILACRCPRKGRAAAEAIRHVTGNDSVEFALLDLGSLTSVRRFARRILATEKRLDVLINNAGITAPPQKRLTREGIEITMATNYLGPFLLTNLLLDMLKRSGQGRVVNVTSALYRLGRVPWEQLEAPARGGATFRYPGVEPTYASSKLLSPRKGARGLVYLASSTGLRDVSGKYFVSCRQSSWSSKVLDEETAYKVWCRSAELVCAVLADVVDDDNDD